MSNSNSTIGDRLRARIDSLLDRLDDQLTYRRRWMLGIAYGLTLASGVLLMFMRQIDAIVRQMRPVGARIFSPSFPTTVDTLTAGPPPLGNASEATAVSVDTIAGIETLLRHLLVLDLLFTLCSTGVLLVCYAVAWRLRWCRPAASSYLDSTRAQLLRIGLCVVLARLVVNPLEDIAILVARRHPHDLPPALGLGLNVVILAVAVVVAVPLAVAGAMIL